MYSIHNKDWSTIKNGEENTIADRTTLVTRLIQTVNCK